MCFMSKVILTGVTPSGSSLHIANYFGALKPLLELGEQGNQVYCFVSDLHALTTILQRSQLEQNIRGIVLDYLACGFAKSNFVFFRQSQVSAHSELAVILANFVSIGQMKRMHAYKDKLAKQTDNEQINLGLFNYPVLMAADILLYQPQLVPVGADQKQHLEIARDLAEKFNRLTKTQTFTIPEPHIDENLGKIIGTDGQRKMSKSLGNIISIFADEAVIEKQIMSCYTDPKRHHAHDRGTVEGNPIFFYHDLWNLNRDEVEQLKTQYRSGEVSDVAVKQALFRAHQRYFAPMRARRQHLASNPREVENILMRGAALARLVANLNLAKAKKALGLAVNFSLLTEEFFADHCLPPISFEHFTQVELRIGKVVAASAPNWSKKLIQQRVDFGDLGEKTIFSALREWYGPEDFIGQSFIYLTNIPKRKMGDYWSEGMILAVTNQQGVPLRFAVSEVATGTLVG